MISVPKSTGFTALLANRPVSRTRKLQCFLRARPVVACLQAEEHLRDGRVDPIADASMGVDANHGLRLGVLVPKRFVRRAVDRNALKRLFRDAVRRESATLLLGDADMLVRVTAPVKSMGPADRSVWWEEIQQLLRKLPAKS